MRQSSLRSHVESRADGRCEYCKAPQNVCGYRFHLEHIIPTVQGGKDDASNRALACATCNLVKADRTTARDPVTDQVVLLFDPRTQEWAEHFMWIDDRTEIIGITATGRATVVSLGLNGEFRIAARKLWFAIGLI
jgi:hypothetical protein